MKTIKIIFIIFFIGFFQKINSQDNQEDTDNEIFIYNETNQYIYVKFYPVSAIFNGRYSYPSPPKYYLKSSLPPDFNPHRYNFPNYLPILEYVVGIDGYTLQAGSGFLTIEPSGRVEFDHNTSGALLTDAEFGYGIYNLELYVDIEGGKRLLNNAPIIMDYSDLNYAYALENMAQDLTIFIKNISNDLVTFKWSSFEEIDIWDSRLLAEDKSIIRCYKQFKRYNNGWEIEEVTPNVGINALSDSRELVYPILGTDANSVPEPFTITQHNNPGLITCPLNINNNEISTTKCGYTLEIANNSTLKLLSGTTTLNVGYSGNPSNCNSELKINSGSKLSLEIYSRLYVYNSCKLILKPQSIIELAGISPTQRSEIILFDGSYYCNEGNNTWRGQGYIYVHRGVKCCIPPTPYSSITTLQDSIKIYLDTGAVFEIPDSSTYSFEGKITEFICDSGATVKFGKNSKLVFSDGAKIKAKYTKFTSLDSNTTWDGIYFNDVSYDTLKNCTIENALNGINVADNTSLYDVPAVEISNCTFSNKTDQTLLNQVYVNNATNVMIRNNTSSSYLIEGFAAGIILEYCTGGVNVIDNNINYVTSGINIIQSSPYIARNTITGTENNGNGIYLDNSNGTVE